jgi:glycosyltransferase involved in cell wall biosynthesis
VVSSFLKAKLLDNLEAISSDNVVVIPMPVGMEHFPKTAPPENEVPVLLSVARYTRQKRLDDIISAAEKIKTEGVAFKIIMVGEGPLEGELKEMVSHKGLNDQIEFMPLVAQQRLGELYRQSDAVILSSEGEGFGLVLVEAGLTGRAVIGAESGGITDIINEGENGILFEVGNTGELAKGMKKILTDDKVRNQLGEGGYKRAIENFATPVLVGRVYDLFISLTANKRSSGSA